MTKENEFEKHSERSTGERKRQLIETSQTDHDRITLDHSGVARTALSVRWEHEADHANRDDDGADEGAAAGPVLTVYRRG